MNKLKLQGILMNTYLNTTLMTLIVLFAFSTTTYAASSCKGQSQSACDTNDSCSWINAHKRKDGNKVKAYCRTKPQKKSATSTKKTGDKLKKDTKSVKKNTIDTKNKMPKEIKTADIIKKKAG
ncbi:MAG: hypothetical protein V7784_14725 [Oceanospirillaceae bacterium]